jgi:sigma-E factor negative regulatory protein RseC
MNRFPDIMHEGTVTGTENGSVIVRLSPGTACIGCHAGESCSVAGNADKYVKVQEVSGIETGQKVVVSMCESQGFLAVFLSYFLPLVILMGSLIICISLSINELISGLISLALLFPYYALLYIFRSRLNRKFTFKLLTTGPDEYNIATYNNKS